MFNDKTMTKQAHKDECDVNVILRKFQRSGSMEHLRVHEGQYGEFAAIDFHEAMETVRQAEEMFLSIPANIRKEFQNDPGVFLEFANDPANLDKLRELGLAYPEAVPAVMPGIEAAPAEPAPEEPA